MDTSGDAAPVPIFCDYEASRVLILVRFEEIIDYDVLIFVKHECSEEVRVVDMAYREASGGPIREIVADAQFVEAFSGLVDVMSGEDG